jgi:hypothetical protein
LRSSSTFRALRQCAFQDTSSHATAHLILVPGQSKQWSAAPQDVGSRGVGIAFGRIEKQVTDARSGNVHVLWSYVREDYACSDFGC